ncbi:MAG: hypothetical protein JXR79_09335 [Nitrospirae bacterium]|nr:hypothetical protein [Nitrospirota bacterium]
MNISNKEQLSKCVVSVSEDFFGVILSNDFSKSIHSIHLVGSAATDEFDEVKSDINSIIALHRTDPEIIKLIAPLGKKYAKKSVAAPLVMPLHELVSSVDAFPVEFLNYKLMHKTIFGEDIIISSVIERDHLRLQCEREARLLHINLTRLFISNLGKTSEIPQIIKFGVKNSIPLLRAIIHLKGGKPPINKHAVVSEFINTSGMNASIFETALQIKEGIISPHKSDLQNIFFSYTDAIENICRMMNDLHV